MSIQGQPKCQRCGKPIGVSADRCRCLVLFGTVRGSGRFAGPIEISEKPCVGKYDQDGERITSPKERCEHGLLMTQPCIDCDEERTPETLSDTRLINRLGAAGAQLQGRSREVVTRQLSPDPDTGLFYFIIGLLLGAVFVLVWEYAL